MNLISYFSYTYHHHCEIKWNIHALGFCINVKNENTHHTDSKYIKYEDKTYTLGKIHNFICSLYSLQISDAKTFHMLQLTSIQKRTFSLRFPICKPHNSISTFLHHPFIIHFARHTRELAIWMLDMIFEASSIHSPRVLVELCVGYSENRELTWAKYEMRKK